MPWVRIDDHFDEHPKHAKAGPLGWALWMSGLAYSNRNMTDGFIPWAVAQNLVTWQFIEPADNQGRSKRFTIAVTCGMTGDDVTGEFVIERLLDAGLWEEVDGGYYIHDYPDYQPLKADIEADREAKRRAGQAGGKATATARATAPATANGIAPAVAKSQPVPNPVPVPNPKPIPKTKESRAAAREPSDNQPFETFAEGCALLGVDMADITGQARNKQIGAIKAALKDGWPEDVLGCLTWLLSDDWRRERGVDFLTVRDNIGKWILAGRPTAVAARSSPNAPPDPADIRRRNQPKPDELDADEESEREAWLAQFRPSKVSAD